MQLAWLTSRRSTCSRLQVGCVLLDPTYEQITVGFNGGPKGGRNECRRDEPGRCGHVHAEPNAIAKAWRGPKIAFLTDAPCEQCSILLVNADVHEVFYSRPYRLTHGLDILDECQVPHTHFGGTNWTSDRSSNVSPMPPPAPGDEEQPSNEPSTRGWGLTI